MGKRQFAPINSGTRDGDDETITGNWTFSGTTTIPEATVTAHEAAINHDDLLNFVSGEHFLQAAISITKSQVSDFPTTVSQAEAEAGTATTDRIWTAQRVAQAIAALESGGGGDKVYRIGHTYGIISKIKVPNGQKDFVIPFFVSLSSGQTAKLVKARHIINDGTSVTCKLQKNDSDITGFTSISVTTTAADTDPTDVTLADNDKIALVVTAISGNPQNMSFTIFIEYTQ